MFSNHSKKAFTLVELLVVIAIIAVLMGVLMPALSRSRRLAYQVACGSNLAGIGKAMMVYTYEYDQKLPKAGGRQNEWTAAIADWQAPQRDQAFGLQDRSGKGKTSISSNLYLLVRHAEVTPKQFVCRAQQEIKEFKISKATGTRNGLELNQAWDFGPVINESENPALYNSYAYHAPFGRYALSTSGEPAMAVAGDLNPWLQPERKTLEGKTWADFIPDQGDSQIAKRGTHTSALVGNSDAHSGKGSNILFLDGHVAFKKRAWCGMGQDNVYTYSTGSPDELKGLMPFLHDYQDSYLKNKQDSCLLQDGQESACTGGVCTL